MNTLNKYITNLSDLARDILFGGAKVSVCMLLSALVLSLFFNMPVTFKTYYVFLCVRMLFSLTFVVILETVLATILAESYSKSMDKA